MKYDIDLTPVNDKIVKLLDDSGLTVAECIGMLECIKFDLLKELTE